MSAIQVGEQKVEQVADIAKAETTASAAAGADILAQSSEPVAPLKSNSFASTVDGQAITSTLDLGEHHRAALAAKEPLDAPKQIALVSPATTSAPTSPGGGFDV